MDLHVLVSARAGLPKDGAVHRDSTACFSTTPAFNRRLNTVYPFGGSRPPSFLEVLIQVQVLFRRTWRLYSEILRWVYFFLYVYGGVLSCVGGSVYFCEGGSAQSSVGDCVHSCAGGGSLLCRWLGSLLCRWLC